MMKYISAIVLAFLFCSTLQAQDKYSSSELEGFVHVYMDQKNIIPDEAVMISLLSESPVTNLRYSQILRKNLANESVKLTKEEKQLLKAIKIENQKFERQKRSALEASCLEKSLDLDLYEEITKLYKSDISFQRSLKPIFDTYLKQQEQGK